MDNMRKIIHLYLKKDNTHHYFGSIKALCDTYGKDELGIVYSSLRAVNLAEKKMYENNKCVIRQGELITTKSIINEALRRKAQQESTKEN